MNEHILNADRLMERTGIVAVFEQMLVWVLKGLKSGSNKCCDFHGRCQYL